MSASGSDHHLKHVPAVLVDLLPEDFSQMCLLKLTERLRCEVEEEEEGSNSSRLVCGPRDGGSTAADVARAHAVLLTVIAVTVLLALTLNSIVIVTIALNRTLHTVINYLIALLSGNQLLWTVFPMIEADIDAHLTPFLCAVRVNVIRTTATFNFGLLVTITFLRYLIVVRRHSYPPHRRNLALFTVIASLPCLVRTVIFYDAIAGTCGTFLAWSRDNYVINRLSEKDNRLRMAVVGLEYVFGIVVIVFCYANILAEAVASRRRLKTHATRASGPASSVHYHVYSFYYCCEYVCFKNVHPCLHHCVVFICICSFLIVVLPTGVWQRSLRGTFRIRFIHFFVFVFFFVLFICLPVDIAATLVLVAFLFTFLVSFTPYLAMIRFQADLKCFVMPTTRLETFTLVTLSGGITAVFNPLQITLKLISGNPSTPYSRQIALELISGNSSTPYSRSPSTITCPEADLG
ncbi:hypothetical protein FJT64_002039 [Amphibalanus amphitrite]|uniref:G-protein coupled receptors family 1 profile domain-containing protein n=1 Tax=Amphibalanus amphitrite TaxID=1232801 RepID=A0A6A4WTE3_AMPAM|nr:hypothetical protein FJT64_002039 [Amphibalanus amphitrite]